MFLVDVIFLKQLQKCIAGTTGDRSALSELASAMVGMAHTGQSREGHPRERDGKEGDL